ncbi:cache domain-containing protein [Sciscionella marina]|uniref:cache domain-containing protein n=1 Tax=Sciscionella marina TaxID=508770 RepID=UPI0003A09DA7|nr:cache domain-containing protein [Sciscionella marina]
MLERIFAALGTLRTSVEQVYAERAGTGAFPGVADLEALRGQIIGMLGTERGLVVGCGFITDVGMLADRPRWLEWWKGEVPNDPVRLQVSLDPTSEEFLDYTRQPWFSTPRSTGQRHVTGPYVDYLCTDEYSLTFTLPVHDGDQFVGVVGSDVYVRGLERVLMPLLRSLGGRIALVNAHGRVVVSTSVRQVTGSLVRSPDVVQLWENGAGGPLYRCGRLPLALLELP